MIDAAVIAAEPDFTESVPSGGYLWWYVDAVSDDGVHGLTMIAFVGSVFSPYYHMALKRGAADPENHVAINIALYGPQGGWAMTERGKASLERSQRHFRVGPSALRWEGGGLTITLDELGMPFFKRIRGEVRLTPTALAGRSFGLDVHDRHRWRPIAPTARVEARFDAPSLSWSGAGYLDSNIGMEPIADGFRDWDWSRAPCRDCTAVLYDMRRREGGRKVLALMIGRDGAIRDFDPPPVTALPPGRIWRAKRAIGCEAGATPEVIHTLEDTPFYARSLVRTRLMGEDVTSFHESLDCDRLRMPVVRMMLPFRMPRRG
ncbi:MAG: carotenoid 1,2-hydratase [Beijerinckiaceae bacterium]